MQTNLIVLVQFVFVILFVDLINAQNNYRNERKRSSHRNQLNDESQEQGRTLGLIRPLLGLGLSTIARPLLGYDVPISTSAVNRPSSGIGTSQSDPYYGHGSYAGYNPNFYSGYNYYGGYPFYRPLFPFYNIYRPQVYPGYYGGYTQNIGFEGQRPVYSNPRPIAQRPVSAQQPVSYPTVAPTTSATTRPVANSAQAAQIANLLGQLLGQQLRPLLNQGAASPSHDDPGITSSYYQSNRFRNRSHRG